MSLKHDMEAFAEPGFLVALGLLTVAVAALWGFLWWAFSPYH
jgi:hypothetical protein